MIGMLDINDGSSGRELLKIKDTIFLYASCLLSCQRAGRWFYTLIYRPTDTRAHTNGSSNLMARAKQPPSLRVRVACPGSPLDFRSSTLFQSLNRSILLSLAALL